MRKSCLVILLVTAFFLAGCAKVNFTPTGQVFPPYDGPVKILQARPAEGSYTEVGWVSAEGDFNNPWSQLLGMMQKEAASKGANAIVIDENFTTRMDTTQVNMGVQNQNAETRSVTAVAIRINP
jgi:hypothetical protein